MLVSTVKLAQHAQRAGFAVPAVNIFDDLSLRSVIAAADAQSAPLIVQVSVKTVRSLGSAFITSIFRQAVGNTRVPVALHLDHCPDRAVVAEVISEGWSSVLFDASDRDLVQAELETREVVEAAHAVGVEIESEIENIIGVEDGVGSDTALHSYSVEELAAVAERTNSDLLAPQLGTAHGEYKKQPRLLPDRARDLVELSGRPVVLHGGTGLSAGEFQSFIDAGVSKINISTAVKMSYMKAAATHLDAARSANTWDPPSLFRQVSSAVQMELEGLIEQFGAAGQAAASWKGQK